VTAADAKAEKFLPFFLAAVDSERMHARNEAAVNAARPEVTPSVFARGIFALHGWRKWALWIGVWTLLGLSQAVRLYVAYNASMAELYISWAQAATWALADWYLWGLLSFVIIRITRVLDVTGKRWLPYLLLHVPIGLGVAALQLLLYASVYPSLGKLFFHKFDSTPMNFGQMYMDFVRGKLHVGLLTYLLIAFVCYAIRYYRQFVAEEQRRARLEVQLAQAQLAALKMQLHPHFLFNTLNAITALVHSDPQAADRMIGRLGEFLRLTLDSEGVQEVSLRSELDFLERYLDIQRIRFQDRMKVNIDVKEELLEARVPNLILQPLVENAIKHGISQRTGPGTVTIAARRQDSTLELEVIDDGPGTSSEPPQTAGGYGLSNTRERLQQLYGAAQSLTCTRDDSGFTVRISLPLRFGNA
jgi:signal transduction histidine kinase